MTGARQLEQSIRALKSNRRELFAWLTHEAQTNRALALPPRFGAEPGGADLLVERAGSDFAVRANLDGFAGLEVLPRPAKDEHAEDARFLLHCVAKRSEGLERLGRALFVTSPGFFSEGERGLRRASLAELKQAFTDAGDGELTAGVVEFLLAGKTLRAGSEELPLERFVLRSTGDYLGR